MGNGLPTYLIKNFNNYKTNVEIAILLGLLSF